MPKIHLLGGSMTVCARPVTLSTKTTSDPSLVTCRVCRNDPYFPKAQTAFFLIAQGRAIKDRVEAAKIEGKEGQS